MKDNLKIIGGALVLLLPLLVIGMIWLNPLLMGKLILTDIILILLVAFLEKVSEQ